MKRLLSVFIAGFLIVGCGGSGVDQNMTVEQIMEKVQTMDVAQLQAKVDQYKKAIEAKGVDLQAVTAKLKEIPITQMLSEDAKKIKGEINVINDAVKELTTKMNVYVKALKDMQAK